MAGDPTRAALRWRDAVRRVVQREIERMRPGPVYATVVSINRPGLTCSVHLDLDPAGVNVTVGMGSVQPNTTGQRVRIEGPTGDRYITAVIGAAFYA